MLNISCSAEHNQVVFRGWILPLLSPPYTDTNGDPGTNLDLFLEKVLEVEELDHHISLSTLGKSPRREENGSVLLLAASPVNCSMAPGFACPLVAPGCRGAHPACACGREAWWAWRAAWTEGKGWAEGEGERTPQRAQ